MAADLTGGTVGTCVLQQRMASGGFGTVYRALDRLLGLERAVKVLHPHVMAEKGFRERFLSELRLTASLDHPNIVRVLYAIDDPQLCGFVMEFVNGPTLRRRIRDAGRLPPPLALDVVVQVAKAVQYSQSRKQPIIHRDLTPENVLLRPDGVVKVMDYGIAAAIEDPALSVSKSIVGKPKYMAPEQYEGEVTPSVDIYALGVILYEALTGQTPFDGANTMAIYRAHVTQSPRPPSELAPGIPRELDDVVLRALAKDPADRFPDAEKLVRALEYVQADFAGKPRSAGDDLLALLRPPAAIAAARVPTPDESARVEEFYNAGFTLLSNQKYAECVEKFDAALRLDPAHFESRRSRRIARVRQLEVSEGQRDRAKMAQFEEEMMRLGFSLYAEKRWEEAAAMFERVLRLNPDRLEAKRYRYEAQERTAAEAEARKSGQARAEAARSRGKILYDEGRFDEAAAAFVEALSADPSDPDARRQAELCSVARSKAAEGAPPVDDPKSGDAATQATRAGLNRFASGDLEGAAGLFAEALRTDPDRTEARTWLEKCRTRLTEVSEARMAAERLARRDEVTSPVLEPPVPGRSAPATDHVYPSDPVLPALDMSVKLPAASSKPPAPASETRSAPAGASLPAEPRRPAFVGRANTLQAMDRVLEETPRGRGAFLLVRGKPGAGKSRIIEEFAARNSYRNSLFLEAKCPGDIGDYFGLWRPVALAAFRAVEAADFLAYTKLAMKFAAEFGRFGESFRKISLTNNRPIDLTVSDERLRELVVEFLSAVLEMRPLFVTLDSLDLADSESLVVLERLAPLTRDRPLVIVGAASMSPAAETTSPWAKVYPRLRSSKIANEFLLPRLPDDDFRKMLGPLFARELKWTGSGEPPRAEARIATEIARVTEGDLNQVEKTCRHLSTTGLVAEEGGLWKLKKREPLTEDDLVSGLGEVLMTRFRGLNTRSAGLVRWLSISEEGLPFDVLGELSGLGQNDLYHAAHELATQKILAEQEERGKKSFAIASPQLRTRVFGEIPQPERQSMADRCAEKLERLDKAHPERAAAVALRGANADRAVECSLRAIDAALEAGRPAEAKSWLEKAEPWLARSKTRGHATAVAERTGKAQLASGHADAALRAYQSVLSGNPPPDRMTGIRLDLARIYLLLGRRREASDALALATEKPRDKRDEVHATLLQARLALLADDLETAGTRLEAARKGADAAGLAGLALSALASFRYVRGETKQAEADATESLERGGAPEALLTLCHCHLFQGKALTVAARLESALENCGDRVLDAEQRSLLAHARAAAGRHAAAREQVTLALQAASQTGAPATAARASLAAAAVALAAEDTDGAREHAAAAQGSFDRCGSRSGLARAAIALGEAHSAAGDQDRASQYFDLAAPAATTPELGGRLLLARAESTLRLGNAAEARAAFHAALEYLGRRWPDVALVGRVYTGLADVHTLNKDRDAALRNFARAFKTLRDSELTLPFALARASWAALLAAHPGKKDEAREAAEIAVEAATTLQGAGMKAAESRARDTAVRLRKIAE